MIIRIITGVRDHFPARVAEWALAALFVDFGRRLLSYDGVFSNGVAWQGLEYQARQLGQTDPQAFWGVVILIIGAIRLMALAINGTFKDTIYSRYSPHVRGFMAILSSFILLQMCLSQAAVPSSTGNSAYSILLVLDVWCIFHAWGDSKRADMKAAKEHGSTL